MFPRGGDDDAPVSNVYDDDIAQRRYQEVNERYRKEIEAVWEELFVLDCSRAACYFRFLRSTGRGNALRAAPA